MFNAYPNVDASWLHFIDVTQPAVELSRAAHREALLRWLNSWGCRIRLAAVPVATGRVARSLGPTAAAKALYAVRPRVVMPWDAAVAARLYGRRDGAAFASHLRTGRAWAQAALAEAGPTVAEDAVPALVGRPLVSLAKILDEYLYVTITRSSIIPKPGVRAQVTVPRSTG